MTELEKRLRRASAAVRHAAEVSVPEQIPQEARPMWKKPVLAFAGTLVGVTVVVGAVALLGDAPPQPLTNPTTAPVETTTSAAVETTSPVEVSTTTLGPRGPVTAECLAAELEVPLPQEDLPEAVATKRNAIIAAAMECDTDTLIQLAGPDLVTSFGGGGPEVFEDSAEGDGVLIRTLVQILATPHAHREHGDGSSDYVWPAAFAHETWDEIPDEDIEALRTFLSDEELDQIAEFGSYADWRVGITPEGDWLFFVAGD